MLESLVITDQKIEFMIKQCYYILMFYNYLKGYRFDHKWVKAWQDESGHLHVELQGSWADTILLEVKVLAIISELYYIMTKKDSYFDYDEYYKKSYAKAERLLEAGCVYSDFGTRRRASLQAEDTVSEQ